MDLRGYFDLGECAAVDTAVSSEETRDGQVLVGTKLESSNGLTSYLLVNKVKKRRASRIGLDGIIIVHTGRSSKIVRVYRKVMKCKCRSVIWK